MHPVSRSMIFSASRRDDVSRIAIIIYSSPLVSRRLLAFRMGKLSETADDRVNEGWKGDARGSHRRVEAAKMKKA